MVQQKGKEAPFLVLLSVLANRYTVQGILLAAYSPLGNNIYGLPK